jgi:hypothetical protein
MQRPCGNTFVKNGTAKIMLTCILVANSVALTFLMLQADLLSNIGFSAVMEAPRARLHDCVHADPEEIVPEEEDV